MWEVDPETKSKVSSPPYMHKPPRRDILFTAQLQEHELIFQNQIETIQLLALQKLPGNTVCVDCGAPSPQWASPKFGTFICLSCAGIHRGLGVHISFVRSISMDSFKVNEVKRMELGGNKAWRAFWEGHVEGGRKIDGGGAERTSSSSWEALPTEEAIHERYSGEVGEEYKERLTAKVEGREYVPVPIFRKAEGRKMENATPRSGTPLGRASPGARSGSPAVGANPRKERNEAYFAKLGNENKSRPADLPPSQGGKYAGFGSGPPPPTVSQAESGEAELPGVDEFQKDPVAALTKGFGWFTTTVGKGAKTVNEGWIQPTAQKVCSPFSDALVSGGLGGCFANFVLEKTFLLMLVPFLVVRIARRSGPRHPSSSHCCPGGAECAKGYERRCGAV